MNWNRSLAFAGRTKKELLRDPLSYIFCLGFPLVMLIIMTVVNNNIPKQANMTTFHIEYLSSGIAVFGLTFVMLFTCLQITKDRSSAFLLRLYASPLHASNFIAGYTLPLIGIAVAQTIITYAASILIGVTQDYTFGLLNLLLAIIVLIPAGVLFIAIGLFFGTLLSEKSAPGMTSVIITAASILGGAWMDIEAMGKSFRTVCNILPFYNMTLSARYAILGEYSKIGRPLLIVIAYMSVFMIVAVLLFRAKMQKDLR